MALADEEIEGLETDLANLPELYRRYQAALKRAGQMDYDDQMVFALQILRAAPPVLAYFQQRYKYFCVDESQDTSKIQHEIIRLLARAQSEPVYGRRRGSEHLWVPRRLPPGTDGL